MDLGLEGKVALVAGASKGMGRATVLRLAQEGARVAYCARSGSALEEIQREVQSLGGQGLPFECDLAERSAARRFVGAAVERFGGADIMVFAPSIHLNREFMDLTDDQWEETFNITFHAGVRMARAVIPHMRARRWGRIVLIGAGSIHKQTVGPGIAHVDVHPDFTTAKAALTNLGKFLSKNFGPDQIFVNTLHPVFVFPPERRAEFLARAREVGPTEQEGFMKLVAGYGVTPALMRLGTSEGFANLVAFLCSEANEYITGIEAAVDGGALDVG
ncbi:MAG: SDR family NAD(P)-dependent oxidoreductase [Gammaproteobacteria bacterium]